MYFPLKTHKHKLCKQMPGWTNEQTGGRTHGYCVAHLWKLKNTYAKAHGSTPCGFGLYRVQNLTDRLIVWRYSPPVQMTYSNFFKAHLGIYFRQWCLKKKPKNISIFIHKIKYVIMITFGAINRNKPTNHMTSAVKDQVLVTQSY